MSHKGQQQGDNGLIAARGGMLRFVHKRENTAWQDKREAGVGKQE